MAERKRLLPSRRTRKLKLTLDRVFRVIAAGARMATPIGRSRLENILVNTSGYSEPGHADPDPCIILAGNWNNITEWDETRGQSVVVDAAPERVSDIFERMGLDYDLQWDDEWYECSDCGKLVRIHAHGSCWKPYFWAGEGFLICGDCIKADPAKYLEHLEGNARDYATIDINLEQWGYAKIEDKFECGHYGGQDADPTKIAQALRKMGIARFLFNLDESRPFDIEFSCWIHRDEMSRFKPDDFNSTNLRLAEDPAEIAKRFLKNCDLAEAALRQQAHGGAIVMQMDQSGAARARCVSCRDIAEGNVL